MDLAELRSIQDFMIKYELQSVTGVSEVASVGGYVRQYQIEIDPDRLRFHELPLNNVVNAVKIRISMSVPKRSSRPGWNSSSVAKGSSERIRMPTRQCRRLNRQS
ncbi:MAG: efflux RND transporter permease subunit [Planctomycetaceae bacterium]